MSFLNKVAIVTGAGSGMGEATALKFAKLSARLSLIDINADSLHRVAKECENLSKIKVLQGVADVSKEEEVKEAIDNTIKMFGKIDIIVNCAGIANDRAILETGFLNDFHKVLNVNLKSVVAITHFAAPALIESKGCVINIASVAATMAIKRKTSYCLSKAAVASFTRNVALELANKGVRVNSISPGVVETNIILNSGKSQEESNNFFNRNSKIAPLQHNIKPVEISDMVVYLASDEAKSITGADFVIDAGLKLSGFPK